MNRPGLSPAVPLWLDHASVQVPALAAASEHLRSVLGLDVTVSAAEPDRHARIYLDRTYLEVAAQPDAPGWRATHFFLRFEDPLTLRAHLEARGLPGRFGVYEGVDGLWEDVEIGSGLPLPILVRRTHPPEVAARWPPPRTRPHRCGARALAAVHVGVTEWQPTVHAYRRLLGSAERWTANRSPDGRRLLRLSLAGGHIVLIETDTPGLAALVLGVRSMDETARLLGLRQEKDDPIWWLDPSAAFGLRLGFVELE